MQTRIHKVLNLNTHSEGEGANTLFFVHGMSCDHEDWTNQIAYFKENYRCVAVDLRAHGSSPGNSEDDYSIELMAEDALQVISDCEVGSVVLVGHSMGCRVIMEMYDQAPQKFSHLILVDGSNMGQGDPDEVFVSMKTFVDTPQYAELMIQFFKDMLSKVTDEKVVDRVMSNAARMPRGIGKKLAPNMAVWDAVKFYEILSRVTIPICLVQSTYLNPERKRISLKQGDNSPFIQYFEKHIDDLTINIIEGSGHFPMLEKADKVNDCINNFLTL